MLLVVLSMPAFKYFIQLCCVFVVCCLLTFTDLFLTKVTYLIRRAEEENLPTAHKNRIKQYNTIIANVVLMCNWKTIKMYAECYVKLT